MFYYSWGYHSHRIQYVVPTIGPATLSPSSVPNEVTPVVLVQFKIHLSHKLPWTSSAVYMASIIASCHIFKKSSGYVFASPITRLEGKELFTFVTLTPSQCLTHSINFG